MSRFHDEVLPPEQKDALRSLAPVAVSEGFHLAGGTALAIQLGHRQSIDFDWFRRAPIADPLQLAAKLRDVLGAFELVEVAGGTVHGKLGGVRVSFFEYGYAALRPTLLWAEFGCPLASLSDLACFASLSYFDDADREPMPVMLNGWTWSHVTTAVANAVRSAVG